MTFASDVLEIERSGPVTTLWVDRAEKRNAMSQEMWSATGRDGGHRRRSRGARGRGRSARQEESQ